MEIECCVGGSKNVVVFFVARESSMFILCFYQKACNDTSCTMDKWLSRLDSSGWLTNVSSVLNCAALIAQSLVQVNPSL